MKPLWDLLGSMKLTVAVLLLLALLTYLGTIAQVEQGLWQVQKDYFESWVVAVDLFRWPGSDRMIKFPLPGAYPLMVVLFLNLLVGGVVRLRRRWQNGGILLTHLGIMSLLLAGFVKLHFSHAGHLALYEGRSGSVYVSFHDYELALLRQDGDAMVERVLPADAIADAAPGRPVTVATGELPFRLQVTHYLRNCSPRLKGPMFNVDVPVVDGVYLQRREAAKDREQEMAGCYVTVTDTQTGTSSEGILWGAELRPFDDRRYPFTFTAGGQTWHLDLRRVTWPLPFSVRLDRFVKDDHPGSRIVREYSSYVTVQKDGRERAQHITMNAPLREGGLVFYQTNWGPQDGSGPPWYSVFEVASNPSDRWEILACAVIGLGLLVHFGSRLWRYSQRELDQARTAGSTT